MKKIIAGLAVALTAAASLAVLALPAEANSQPYNSGGCSGLMQNSMAQHKAWTWDYNGGCGVVEARHYYYYCQGSPGVPCWTSWALENSTHVATSAYAALLQSSQHRFWIYGNRTTISLAGS